MFNVQKSLNLKINTIEHNNTHVMRDHKNEIYTWDKPIISEFRTSTKLTEYLKFIKLKSQLK